MADEKSDVTLCIDRRRVVLRGDITNATALTIVNQLRKLHEHDKVSAPDIREPIAVFIETRGGDVYACMKLYHLIERYGIHTPIFTIGFGESVRSGGFYILQSGTMRFGARGTRLQFHRCHGPLEGTPNADEIYEQLALFNLLDATQLHIFHKRGRPIKTVTHLFRHEKFLGAAKAHALHLIDAVLPNTDNLDVLQQRAMRHYNQAKDTLHDPA